MFRVQFFHFWHLISCHTLISDDTISCHTLISKPSESQNIFSISFFFPWFLIRFPWQPWIPYSGHFSSHLNIFYYPNIIWGGGISNQQNMYQSTKRPCKFKYTYRKLRTVICFFVYFCSLNKSVNISFIFMIFLSFFFYCVGLGLFIFCPYYCNSFLKKL